MINKNNLIIHPLFFILSLVMCFIYGAYYVLLYFIAVFIHEYAHFWQAKRCGVVLNGFSLMPYGARLNLKQSAISYKDDVLISLAGPLANLLSALLCCAVWWVFPSTYAYLDVFVYASLCLALFNLLPILPLDGARVVLAICSKYGRRSGGYKCLLALNYIAFLLLFICFVYSLFTGVNITVGIIAFFVLFSCFDNDNSYYYQSVLKLQNFKLIKNKPIEVKAYVLSSSSDVTSVYKLINPSYYTVIVVEGEDGKKKIVAQSDFEKYFFSKGDTK